MRAPLVRHGARALVAAAVALTALATTACGDDDGVSLLEPGRGLQGMWVRYQPPPCCGLPVALPRPVADTLFLGNDLSGRWSREVPNSMGPVPLRMTEPVVVKKQGLLLFLYPVRPPCPNCESASPVRLNTVAVPESWRMRRTDEDHLVLESSRQPELWVERYYYVRELPIAFRPD